MTDLSTSNLKHLLAEQQSSLPSIQWTYKGGAANGIHRDYPSKREELEVVRVGMELSPLALAAAAPDLAREVLRMREELIAWANDEAQAHNALVRRAQEAVGAGIITTHKTIYNRILDILGDHDE